MYVPIVLTSSVLALMCVLVVLRQVQIRRALERLVLRLLRQRRTEHDTPAHPDDVDHDTQQRL